MLRFTMIIQMNFSALKLIVGVFVIAWHKQEFFFVVGMATYKRCCTNLVLLKLAGFTAFPAKECLLCYLLDLCIFIAYF